jgi:hypothetical protein
VERTIESGLERPDRKNTGRGQDRELEPEIIREKQRVEPEHERGGEEEQPTTSRGAAARESHEPNRPHDGRPNRGGRRADKQREECQPDDDHRSGRFSHTTDENGREKEIQPDDAHVEPGDRNDMGETGRSETFLLGRRQPIITTEKKPGRQGPFGRREHR